MAKRLKQHAIWGRGSFILAATGSAVGLGNIWKFPYITGENGGAAFVLLYLVCVALVGIPIMMAEIMIGRKGRANPVTAMSNISSDIGSTRLWSIIGWMGVLAGFFILSYYSVIAGWTLDYLVAAIEGKFGGLNGESSNELFNTLLADQSRLVQWHTAFISMTALVLMFGVTKGLENAIRFMMPTLFILLLILLGYAFTTGEIMTSARFMFSFNIEDLSWNSALLALGHAFFTLSIGMGAIMAYGAYMPSTASIGKTVITVAVLDVLVGLLTGVAIFAFVFATPGIEPSSGPGLMFVTLPVAFGSMPMGTFLGIAFFGMVVLAAWSSTMSLLEPGVAYLHERFGFHRISASLLVAGAAWLLGLGSVLSFNQWSEQELLWGMNFYSCLDFFTTNLLLPSGGLLTAIFVGWIMKRELSAHEMQQDHPRLLAVWRWVLRYVSPIAVLAIIINLFFPIATRLVAD
ncbi:MAG: sodium-dependent transporter [Gammaproteobacteria bacterium]|nr:MAG: sodium-dependent transporter [Gammaproteobacteria bacterium]